MSNGQDAQWSRMTFRAHTNAWLHRHEDLEMASRTRSGPGEWNHPRDMENIPRVVERDAFCFCFTPALPERSDIREDDRYSPPPLHSTSLPPRYTHSSRLLATRQWHAWPSGMQLLLARRARVRALVKAHPTWFVHVGDKGMCGSRPPLEGMAFVLSFSPASDGASATYPNGASDSDAWARVPQIGIHPERVSRGGRGKGLAASRGATRPAQAGYRHPASRWVQAFNACAQRDTRPPDRGAPSERHGHHRLSTTDSVIYECAHVYHGGTRRWRDGVAVRPRRLGHDPALARCAWEKTLAEGDASFAEREDTVAGAAVEDRWPSRQHIILFASGLRAGSSGSTLASPGVDVGGVGRELDAAVSA
ncbi:uncharacterized protein SCHCODRAFT_02587301 [Schizophyllum commune H4-8]|uniref:Uncharacterized protein n=1 Tax=Schizophyllum commune (strain H4-8 / FGSC 9210) TaxID=578458 RepID=D8QEE3_SCHCM|nr:uncharacterized protein SCHCODRAFT_02587301 [Schizophyllum commune H4-8]KAI5888320.1 hypothetical protein SCHCODRAFT_02587301 [Schizophyllum commune H4-8]